MSVAALTLCQPLCESTEPILTSRHTIIVFAAFLCYHTALATDVKVSSQRVEAQTGQHR